MAMAKCCLHLPGNKQCPYEALYEVIWSSARSAASRYMRPACIQHLARAVDEALDDSARGATVEVRIANK